MSFRRYFAFIPFFVPALSALHAGGCSATPGVSAGGQGTAPAPEDAASGAGSQGGGAPPESGGSGELDAGDLGGQGGLDPDASCAQTSAEAALVPLDIIVLLDRSGSMLGSKWNGVTNAIVTFVTDPASAGVNVGLTYFPRGLNGQNDCSDSTYRPLAVSVAELPAQATAVTASIQTTTPTGGTPMRPALQGVLWSATEYQDANPTHKVIVVLATDGDPSGCSGNTVAGTAEMAARALNYNGVQTYVIAVEGSTLTNLNQIAAAGGTARAYDVTSDITAFSARMEEIRASALPCELLIPDPPSGEALEQDRVAVRYSPGGAGAGGGGHSASAVEIPRADDVNDCGGAPGWYYDDDRHPDKIILCPASCAPLQSDPQARLTVLFGCEPKLN
jgi:uncharacterized protein YegL